MPLKDIQTGMGPHVMNTPQMIDLTSLAMPTSRSQEEGSRGVTDPRNPGEMTLQHDGLILSWG